ncbi:2,5-diamino-6-(ribosylamino)-4(3H)-pyrimidinone 5'-phosphate reductase [Methanopyrus kandleri]|uniref:2,5-diamino-6-(ribosylamino)-4(3H)-pyrimidinone 5'-phosphate reductase n=2 Tax=Methanopyrus kandleri TaxID=2320 RepID=Q8TZ41_METKA|nr:2,5-diamino-6-(ribosylamino)-4(3H)-pyrimidinone 5'-phosphate reductase [Methanopyrus kandleri]AAM01315.1 Pyrimidine reductase [Methanopyrus kandleri AV19]HII70762.1 2,5-diamino-6-(ribosylamino)-4(3H)-pyrimidinone 5'-phosphate reductase [Methanopyrus kandleri]
MPRPKVLYNVGMTADGKVVTAAGDSRISGEEDLKEVHRLRAEHDAVAVGINTVRKDDPMLNVRLVEGEDPIRVVFDTECSIPLDCRLVRTARDIPTVVLCAEADPGRVEKLEKRGVKVEEVGACEDGVDVERGLELLYDMGVRTLLLEGGPTLAWSFLKRGLIDEFRVAVAPVLVGGSDALTPVEGEGFPRVDLGVGLELKRVERVGRDVVLWYEVSGSAADLASEHEEARGRSS